MSEKYKEPEYKLGAFNCPHCGAFAHQKWYALYQLQTRNSDLPNYNQDTKLAGASSGYVCTTPRPVTRIKGAPSEYVDALCEIDTLSISRCDRCNDFCIWLKDKKIYPISYWTV